MAKIWNGLCICVWILGTNFTNNVLSSHFQGAAVSWRPGQVYADEDKIEILIDFRIAWRRSTEADSPGTFCDEVDVQAGKTLGREDDEDYRWVCLSGCSGVVAPAEVTCTQFDEEDDWSVGFRTVAFNVTGTEEFEVKFSGCCWISTLVYSTNAATIWNLTTRGSTATRSDTGLPNRSPISAATPVIRFQAGCPDYVDLIMYDADQDTVRCRMAECNNPSCTLYPYLKLTQQGDKCRLSYNAGGPGKTNAAISIILEDFPKRDGLEIGDTLQNTTNVLSSVSLQFIVKLYNDIHLCSSRPTWINPTYPNGFAKAGIIGHEMAIEIRIKSDESLNTVNVIGPPGLTKGPIVAYAGSEYGISLSFTPTSEQMGPHMVCLTAKDINGKMSEQRCMVLNIGVGSPCGVENGGCDDVCVQTGDSYVCECGRSCWRLAEDRRTCIPNITIDCHADHFAIELPTCAVSASTVTIGYYEPSGTGSDICVAEVVEENYVKAVNYAECLTQQETDFTEIHYHNQIRMWVDDVETSFAGSGDEKITITRGYYYNLQLVCSFNKYANVNATFRPQDQEEGLVRVPGLGSFQFFFDFYIDEDFGAAYSPYDYPITVTVNSDIYFGIRTVGGTGLEVFTEKCVAMTTPTPTESTVSYTMIENGCFNDGTLQKYKAPSTMEERYSIKAFRFQDNLNADDSVNIYIQCSAVLCVVGDPATRCQKGCIRTRKRRGGSDEIYIDTRQKRAVEDQHVQPTFVPNVTESNLLEITVSGPFRIEVVQTEGTPLVTVVTPTNVQPSHTPKKPIGHETTRKTTTLAKEPDSLTVIIIASSVGGVLVMLFLVVLVGLVIYYQVALKPRHKVIPGKEEAPTRSISAWTLDRHDVHNPPPGYDAAKTPPPSFWDVHYIT